MDKELLSVGIDVGTTTTQMVVSRLTAQNRAGAFAVPRLDITKRTLIYESPVHFTPLVGTDLVDGSALEKLLREEYEKAGIQPEDVDTGAVIITGETSRRENAETVVRHLSHLAGDFVVATAGPDLESILAAKGAGATELSAATGKQVLHMDMGGGTSNLCLIQDGQVIKTGCLNVGGRLIKLNPRGEILWISPVLTGVTGLRTGETLTREEAVKLCRLLARVLEMAAGRREKDDLYSRFLTPGAGEIRLPGTVTVSLSGGVADCVEREIPWLTYGDLGPLLGQAIRESRLMTDFVSGSQTIRATVIGAGCHSVQLSGSTVFRQNVSLPVQNLPVAVLTQAQQDSPELRTIIQNKLSALDAPGILYLPGWQSPSYSRVTALADILAETVSPCRIVLQQDMAKALGTALSLRLPGQTPILCVDGLSVPQGSYLDIGEPVGSALTAVVKTLVFEKTEN